MTTRDSNQTQDLQGVHQSSLRDAGTAICMALAAAVFGTGCASSKQHAAPDTASNQILGKGVWEPPKSPLQLKRAEVGHGVYINELGQAGGFMNPTVPIENLRADFRMANGEVVKTDLHLFGGWIREVGAQMAQVGQTSVIVDLNGTVIPVHPEQPLKVAKVAPCPRRNG